MTAFQTFTAGQILTAAQQTALQANSTQVAIFQDQKASGTSGGTATAGAWTARVLQTSVLNNITGCSLATNTITLTAGSYFINATAFFYKINAYQMKIRNTTAGTDLITGISTFAASSANIGNNGMLSGYITLTGSTNLQLQYWVVGPSINTNDLGVAVSSGTNECYATLTIQQVA